MIWRYMHYVTSSCVIQLINNIAVFTPTIANKINITCLNRSIVEQSSITFSKFDIASHVPPMAATIFYILKLLAMRPIDVTGGSAVIKEPMLPMIVPPITTPNAIKKQCITEAKNLSSTPQQLLFISYIKDIYTGWL